MSFAAVLCLLFPALLTSPHLREIYPMGLVRGLINFSLIAAFFLGVISIVLRRNKTLGLAGVGFTLLAVLLGGSKVRVEEPVAKSNYAGLDWFLLDLFLLALVFVPLERMFARLRDQRNLPTRLDHRPGALPHEPPRRAGPHAHHHGA